MLEQRCTCLDEGTLESDPLSQQDISEMFFDAWLRACLKGLLLCSLRPWSTETPQGSRGCTVARAGPQRQNRVRTWLWHSVARCFSKNHSLFIQNSGNPRLLRPCTRQLLIEPSRARGRLPLMTGLYPHRVSSSARSQRLHLWRASAVLGRTTVLCGFS